MPRFAACGPVPGRAHVRDGGLPCEGHRVYCVLGSRSHLVFNFAYSGGGLSGFDVVSHFGGCGFLAGRAIDEIDDHQHTDRTTLPTCMLFLVQEMEGQVQGLLRSFGFSKFHGFPAGAHGGEVPRSPAVVDSSTALAFNGTSSRPRGSTRPQAFNEAASRPPAVVDSSTALAFNEADVRAWIDNPLLEHSKECVRDRTNSLGLFLHGRPGGRSKWLVRRLRRIHPLGLGGC